jgi:hypothetical protein
MPELNVLLLPRPVGSTDYYHVQAVMAFPSDPDKRQLLEAELLQDWLKGPRAGSSARIWSKWEAQRSEWDHPQLDAAHRTVDLVLPPQLFRTSIAQEAVEQSGRGLISGIILAKLLTLARRDPKHASLTNAKLLVGRLIAGTNRSPDGAAKARIPESPRALDEIWSEFKTVAHLHFALFNHRDDLCKAADVGELSTAHMIAFLTDAQAALSDALKLRIKRAAGPVLDAAEVWRPSAEVARTLPAVALRWPRLTATERYLLKKITSRHS